MRRRVAGVDLHCLEATQQAHRNNRTRRSEAMLNSRFAKPFAIAGTLILSATTMFSAQSFAQDADPADLVKDLHAIFGEHHARAVHAKGIILEGSFEPAPDAPKLSKANVFAAKSTATMRLSNTTGIPDIPDADPNASPHGLAIKVKLADGSEMDIVTHSYNGFPAATSAEFGNFLKAIAASGPNAPKPTEIEKYIEASQAAKGFVTQQKPPPESFATTAFFGVNAFTFTDAAGKATAVRTRLVPQAGEKYLDPATAPKDPNYLMTEASARVAKGPMLFDWLAQIAETSDKIDDPSVAWPEDRKLVKLGTFKIERMAADQEGLSKSLLFLPNNVPDGIAPADPMIDVRSNAYPVSFGERQ
jgi:catalase